MLALVKFIQFPSKNMHRERERERERRHVLVHYWYTHRGYIKTGTSINTVT